MIEITRLGEGGTTATLLVVRGSLDVASRGELERSLEDLVQSGENSIRLDLSGVDYLGSVGLAVLINASKTLRRRGGELRIVTSSAQTRRHLKLLNLESMLASDAPETNSSANSPRPPEGQS